MITVFIIGLILILYFSEKLVESAVGTSVNFGISAFLVSLIFIGFDPENLFLGAVASYEGAAGIAAGTIIGSAMVAVTLAFGITAAIVPMKFEKAPLPVLLVPVLAVVLVGLLAFDGMLSRIDGAILLAGYIISVGYLVWLGRKGLDIRTGGETAEALEDAGEWSTLKSIAILVVSLAAIILGSELLVESSRTIISQMGLTGTLFGMTILALIVSIEEVARELPAALRGRPDITYGNVAGSILAFFLFNAGIIALVRPVPVGPEVIYFYLPFSLAAALYVTYLVMQGSVPRSAGITLILVYIVFFAWGFV